MANYISSSDLTHQTLSSFDLVVVGAGFFGLTIAERSAHSQKKVLIIESRGCIGGNSTSYLDPQTSVEVHPYGSHLFHTSNPRVWDYAKRFTDFNTYQHTVWAIVDGARLSLPINLQTISFAAGRTLNPSEGRDWLQARTAPEASKNPKNFKQGIVSQVGEELYRMIFEGYTAKQWQTDPENLPAEIANRLPVRTNLSNRYFADRWEGLPLDGYSQWHERMVESELISIALGVDFFDHRSTIESSRAPIVYTGPIDRYFDFSEGELSWRTLDFELETLDTEDFQGTAVVNYPDVSIPFTRIHEFKHLHPERWKSMSGTVIMREFSRKALRGDEPYYPVNSLQDRGTLARYRELVERERRVVFGGRLGSYLYLDMHMAIASALVSFESRVLPLMESD